MKAKIKPRIELKNRTKLEHVIPLQTPFVVFVDPADACNFQCKFCPTGDRKLMKEVNRTFGLMDFDLYKKVIDDICEFDEPIKVLRLYKDGEPLLHPKLPEMIRYAKERKCALQIDTTTNGSLLNPEKNIELIEAGLDRINISVEGISEEQYKEFSQYNLNFDQYVENIKHLHENSKDCEILVKICGDVLSEDEKQKFYDIFGDISDSIFIEHVAPCWPEFEFDGVEVNQEFGIYGQEIKEVEVCPYIFYSTSVNSDGTVSLCFLDWSRKLLIGDLNKESLKDVWNGQELFEYQKMFLLKNRREHSICGACGQLSHCLPDNIDSFAEELLKNITNERGIV